MPTTPRAKKDEAEGKEAPSEAQAEAQDEAKDEAPAEAPAEEAPPSQVEKGGETAYSPERLIEDAEGFLGQPSYIVAGALHESEEEYLTVDEAKQAVEDFLSREVTSG